MGFTIKRDILLLRSALNQNPWQLGDGKWKDIVEDIKSEFKGEMTVRTAKGRVTLLLKNYDSQQLETTYVFILAKYDPNMINYFVVNAQDGHRGREN